MKAFLLINCLLWGGLSLAQDAWPQYRGPNRDGVSPMKNILKSWPESGPKQLWKVSIGTGFSAIAVVDGHVYTMFADGDREFLGCFNEANGTEKWRLDVGALFKDEFGDGPRSGPVVDGDLVFGLGSNGQLHAANRKTGKEVWKVSFTEAMSGKVARWGYSSTPLVDGDRLIVEVGGGEERGVAALDKKTGKTLWSAYNGETGYVSPIAIDYKGQRQYVFIGTKKAEPNRAPPQELVGFSKDGKVLWSHEIPGFTVAMPIFVGPDKIFVSASNDDGCRLIQLKEKDGKIAPEELWQSRYMKNHFNSSVVYKGHVFGFSNATLTCLSLETGERKWSKRGLGKGSLVLVDNHFMVLSDKGRLLMIEASTEGYRQISAWQALEGKSWTEPTAADGKLFLRNLTEMSCIDLRKS